MAEKGRQYVYERFDVFTDQQFSGNPVAIVYDAQTLSDTEMMAITREFNLSETVFVLPPKNPMHKAYIRIFKPTHEMPYAGHPTIGTVIALALRCEQQNGALIILEEKIGLIRAAVDRGDGAVFAEFDLPKLPEQLASDVQKETFAAAFGFESHEIGFENHVSSFWSAGVPFYFVPVKTLKTVASAIPDPIYIAENFPDIEGIIPSFYLYCRETQIFQSAFHARMIRADGSEDAATGSAASAFCGVVQHFDSPLDGLKQIWLEQGMEMGRPSRIRLEWEVVKSKLVGARLGGHAVKIAQGTITLD